VGSNTVHLLVVDARSGGRPSPLTSEMAELRLAEQLDSSGCVGKAGIDALVQAVARAAGAAAAAECVDLLAFATSALRDAENCDEVVDRVRAETGVVLRILPGEDEARDTFLAARRWYGWSAGRLLVRRHRGWLFGTGRRSRRCPGCRGIVAAGCGATQARVVHDRPALEPRDG
jgi:exopolyphosphatase / guanosine-5'-triphosphate,3'-diphosphate pyrophosphatase